MQSESCAVRRPYGDGGRSAAAAPFLSPLGFAAMRSHIKTVAIVNIIYSAVGMLKAISVLLGGVFGSLFSGSLATFLVGGSVSVLTAMIMGAGAVFGLIAGFGLLNHRPWARYVAIVFAVLSLLNFPFGTLFAVYTLWVMLNAETKRIFETGGLAATY